MQDLRRIFESCGFAGVETFIASGNVIFESPERAARKLELTIEKKLEGELGYSVATFIRTIAEVSGIADMQPFGPIEPSAAGTLYVVFLRTRPKSSVRDGLMCLNNDIDQLHVGGREVYWHCRKHLGESLIDGPVLGRMLNTEATVRNMNTVRRIADKYS
jgi:uncharacterized protein (DUF1697 family)